RELRGVLIGEAGKGSITPDEAEAKAKAAGIGPLASTPDHSKFDPVLESRWTLVMVIAWIAWRNLRLVTEQRAEFREAWTNWSFYEWNIPTQGGNAFDKREGWLLETRPPATVVELTFRHVFMREHGELPPSTKMSPAEAELELRRKLSDD